MNFWAQYSEAQRADAGEWLLFLALFIAALLLGAVLEKKFCPPVDDAAVVVAGGAPPWPAATLVAAPATVTCVMCRRERPLRTMSEFECLGLSGYVCRTKCTTEGAW